MRVVYFLSCLALAFLGMPFASYASGPPDMVAGAARRDSQNGACRQCAKVEIVAKSDANGDNPSGKFSLREEFPSGYTIDIEGEVNCLAVRGKRAVASGSIVKSNDEQDIGWRFVQIIDDNGEGWDDSDASRTRFFEPGDYITCSSFLNNSDPVFEMSRGNYEVKDR